ncbi:MAG: hypothetical protein ACKVJW_06690 [Flavobacteriales bacterium]
MLKNIIRINLLVAISFFTLVNTAQATNTTDSITRTEFLNAFDWEVISGIENIMQHDNMEQLSKNSIKKLNEGNTLYSEGIQLMENKNYTSAIEKFMLARKSYKRAKISTHAYNYININQALCYASSGKEKDKAVASRYISLVTNKIDKEQYWLYNLSIANHLIGNYSESSANLSQSIRLDENYFQAYITLEQILRNTNDKDNADKVRDRMETAEAKVIKKANKNKRNNKTEVSDKTEVKQLVVEGVEPNITKLKIIKGDDNLKFNKVALIKERTMSMVQEGIGAYNNGTDELSNGNYKTAITELKIAEKKLKRGKIKEHGLNFSRAQLSIAYLCTGEKSKYGQVKRNLRKITNKLYYSRDWTYNLAVANYTYGVSTVRGERNTDKWISKAKNSIFLKTAIKLFKLTIKHDKLYLAPYENLVYVYTILGDDNKAEKYQEQIKMGVANEYVFRIHMGVYEEYEAPADMFDEEYLITVPINERKTAYLAGMYYSLDDAIVYQKEMIMNGYLDAYIVAYKDGDKIDF